MHINYMGACMWREICALSQHSSAKLAMIEFCKLNREQKEGPAPDYLQTKGISIRLSANLYAFTGVVGYKRTISPYENVKTKPKYGPNFAKFIEENELGRLIETWDGLINKNHLNHKVKIWLWNPDHAALSKWWEKNRPSSIVDGERSYFTSMGINKLTCELLALNKLKRDRKKKLDLVAAKKKLDDRDAE